MRARPLLLAALLAAAPFPASAHPSSTWLPPSPIVPDLRTAAPPGAVLYGVVRTTSGQPVAGAVVSARPISRYGVADSAVTDAAGRYALKRLVPSGIDLSVTARGMGRIGPLPMLIPSTEEKHPMAQELDIGGMGPAVPLAPKPRSAGTLKSHLVMLPAITRDLIPDGRGGLDALELTGLVSLGSGKPRPEMKFGALALGASWGASRGRRLYEVSSPGGLQQLSSTCDLAAFDARGHRIWSRSLPFQPAAVAAGGNQTAWVVGAHEGFGIATLVSRTGAILRSIALSPGSALRVATDRSGDGWIIDRKAGLVRIAPDGRIKARVYLPEMPFAVQPTPEGGLWAIGGGIATLIDAHDRPILRVVRPQPIDLSAVDSRGRLWILESGKLLVFAPHFARSYELSGMPIQGAAGLAFDDDRRLWLLGLDRRRVAVARIP